MAQTKKTQIGSIGLKAAVHPCETEPKPAPSKCEALKRGPAALADEFAIVAVAVEPIRVRFATS
jgi:hypothetical protein